MVTYLLTMELNINAYAIVEQTTRKRQRRRALI